MPATVHALIGEDALLLRQAMADILDQLPRDVQRIDVDGDRIEWSDVLDELQSFAMFGGGKLVVVREADAFIARFRAQLETYLEHPSDTSTLVLRCLSLDTRTRIFKLIEKNGRVVRLEPPRERELPGWIIQHAKRVHQLQIAPDAAALLADLIGNDLGRLDNELAKLALRSNDAVIRAGDIAGTVAFQREQEMWHMTDALSAGNLTEALRRWRHMVQMDPSTEFRAVTWLGLWLENVRKALTMRAQRVPDTAIAKACKIWDARLHGPFFRTVEQLGRRGVDHALGLLIQADRRSKSGLGDARSNVERFMISLNLGTHR